MLRSTPMHVLRAAAAAALLACCAPRAALIAQRPYLAEPPGDDGRAPAPVIVGVHGLDDRGDRQGRREGLDILARSI